MKLGTMKSNAARCRSALAVSLALLLGACGGGGSGSSSPPSISNLSYTPTSVPITSAGNFTVSGTVNFTDSGGDVSSLTLTITDASGAQVSSSTQPIPGASGHTSGTLSGSFAITARTSGVYTIHITVTDSGGSKSNELTGPFEIVPVDSQAAVVTTTGPGPASLTSANGQLYWTESGTNALLRVPVSGGAAQTLATRVVDVTAMSFVGSDVIWQDDRPDSPNPCGLQRVISRTTAAGATTALASGFSCAIYTASDLIVVGNWVYWVSSTNSPDRYVLYATPIAGGMSTIVTQGATPIVALAADSGTLYWMEDFYPNSVGAIKKIPVPSGAITTLASGFASAAYTIAVDGSNVYYTTPNYPRVTPPFTETLWAQPITGGAPTVVSSSISTPIRLAAAAGSVRWIDASGVNTIPVGGGAITQLAATANPAIDLLISGGSAIWSEPTGPSGSDSGAIKSVPLTGGAIAALYQSTDAPQRLALDGSAQLNWIEGGTANANGGFSRIARLSSSGPVQTVLSGLSTATPAFVVNGTDIYIADLSRIKRLSLGGGMPESVIYARAAGPIAKLAIDGSKVYWDSAQAGSVYSAPLAGGPVTTIASAGGQAGMGGSIRLGADGNVYWLTTNGITNSAYLLSAPKTGGTAGIVAQQGLIGDFVVDAARAYYVDPMTHNILAQPLSSGAGTALTSGTYFGPSDPLVLDGTNLYVLSSSSQIVKVTLADRSITPVLDFTNSNGANANASLAVDATNVYWTETATLDIRKSAK